MRVWPIFFRAKLGENGVFGHKKRFWILKRRKFFANFVKFRSKKIKNSHELTRINTKTMSFARF
ncbi:MAG TPA: hypothetical protein DDW84_03240 [Phycisphaerales bacterium]|nr:MAG: hypothetical protein A2Y13_05265 [Planctomycetes bacterium GWC2_45_44]HBG77853.1 hypothetical protein [Phycisphaerales bacterium]HBR19480.1 hypothetical protein [Phycisphaerales bacterium]